MVQTKEEKRASYLRRQYGITPQDYEALLRAHEGGCWICGRLPTGRRLHVEHDHKTGKVRGLACWACNKLLREARDNQVILASAAKYLASQEAEDILSREK